MKISNHFDMPTWIRSPFCLIVVLLLASFFLRAPSLYAFAFPSDNMLPQVTSLFPESSNKVTKNPPNPLPEGASVSVQMPTGLFTDLARNRYASIADGSTRRYTTVASPSSERRLTDQLPPTYVALSPADNTTGVPDNTNLVITFSENIRKGTGAIIINQSNSRQTIAVSSPSVTVAGNQVTIDLLDNFPIAARVNIQILAGSFTDTEGNAFTGINNPALWNFRINDSNDDSAPLQIITTDFPNLINTNAANVEASLRVTQLPPGTTADIIYRGIAQTNWSRTPATVNYDALRISAVLPQTWFDELGLEYYFEVKVFSTINILSDRGYTYLNYTGDGLSIPGLQFGSNPSSYQIISIPLELRDPSVAAVLEDNLGTYNPRRWRLFTFKDSVLQEFQQGFTTLEPSRGYWLIVKDKRDVSTGEGSTHKVSQDSPYIIRLQKGWNQIGNPYPFNVSWPAVKTFNQNLAGLGNLRVFENGFKDTLVLPKFRGAFVFAEKDMVLRLPVVKNNAVNGRRSQEQEDDPDLAWLVTFSLQSGDLQYHLGGLGMHRKANISKDPYDDMTVPRFGQYLELNFDHPEYFVRRFTKDLVPPAGDYQWTFTVASNADRRDARMNWYAFTKKVPPGKRLYLFDIRTEQIIDMTRQKSYSFLLDSAAVFRVFYGSDDYMEKNLPITAVRLGDPFPNPFSTSVQLPVALPQSANTYRVRLQIFSALGSLCHTKEETAVAAGIQYFTWNGMDGRGRRAPAGLYVCQWEVTAPELRKKFTQKLILR